MESRNQEIKKQKKRSTSIKLLKHHGHQNIWQIRIVSYDTSSSSWYHLIQEAGLSASRLGIYAIYVVWTLYSFLLLRI